MSYILDALKKAERERGLAQVPTLSTVHDLPTKPRIHLWIISGVFVLCICVAALWLLLSSAQTNVERAPVRIGEPAGAVAPPAVERESATARSNEPAPTAVPAAELPVRSADAAMRKPAAGERALSPPARAPAVPRFGAPESDIPPHEEIERQPPQPAADDDDSAGEPPSAMAAPAKPKSVREAVAGMTISIHMYSDIKEERLVFINGRRYVEGDLVEGRYLLESITPEGAVLSYAGELALLRVGSR